MSEPNSESITRVQRKDAGLQPSSKHCFVCGVNNPHGLHLRFYSTASGEVEVNYTVPEHFQGYPGVVHGGIVAAMLDEAAGRVYMDATELGSDLSDSDRPPRFMYTAKLEIRYRKNVPVGKALRLLGKGIKDNGRTATARSYIYGDDGALLAEAEALLVNIPNEIYSNVDLEELGWKVYPDERDGV